MWPTNHGNNTDKVRKATKFAEYSQLGFVMTASTHVASLVLRRLQSSTRKRAWAGNSRHVPAPTYVRQWAKVDATAVVVVVGVKVIPDNQPALEGVGHSFNMRSGDFAADHIRPGPENLHVGQQLRSNNAHIIGIRDRRQRHGSTILCWANHKPRRFRRHCGNSITDC